MIARLGISVGIIAVPAQSAQEAADRLIEAGVTGLVNSRRSPYESRRICTVESHDLLTALERALAGRGGALRRGGSTAGSRAR